MLDLLLLTKMMNLTCLPSQERAHLMRVEKGEFTTWESLRLVDKGVILTCTLISWVYFGLNMHVPSVPRQNELALVDKTVVFRLFTVSSLARWFMSNRAGYHSWTRVRVRRHGEYQWTPISDHVHFWQDKHLRSRHQPTPTIFSRTIYHLCIWKIKSRVVSPLVAFSMILIENGETTNHLAVQANFHVF